MKRKSLLLALLLLLAAGLCVAQDAQQQPSSSQPSAQQTDVGKPTDMDQQLFKGCVGGTKDNYTLTDDKGTQYRLHSDKDINEHVGNMVEIKGTIKKEGADSQKASTSPAKEIDVADIKNVSNGCAAGTK
jgi:hypothetical protein